MIEPRRNVWSTPLGQATLAKLGTADGVKAVGVGDVLARIIAAQRGMGTAVTPENCMRSPTVRGIVSAISERMAVTPVHVYRKVQRNGREAKERLPNHPVAKLLQFPNKYQTRTSFWEDAASCFVRHGNFYAFKARGATGPIRELNPLHPNAVTVKQDDDYSVRYEVREASGGIKKLTGTQLLHARGGAREFVKGDSPIEDVKTTIALEIAAEEFGLTFFQNGALPLMVFKFLQGNKGFKTKEQEDEFISSFQSALGGSNRHKALLLPSGMDAGEPVSIENDKAQFLETRRLQRTIIAGAFGFPPHMIGHLEGSTYTIEQQDQDFVTNCMLPVGQAFEAAMERDLLTDEDWSAGVIIRFNFDSILRADFKSRQEGLSVQRQQGIISANEWREREGMNPLEDDKGGEDYLRPVNMAVAGQEPPPAPSSPPAAPATDGLDKAINRLKQLTLELQ